jgi:hypothetical protein
MTALRTTLNNVPQDPTHHPEGTVWKHTVMVRKALPMALQVAREAFRGVSCLSLWKDELTTEEIGVLRASAWMHDIGKSVTTTLYHNGDHIEFSEHPLICQALANNDQGKWKSLKHDHPKNFKKALRSLKGSLWEKVWDNASFEAKKDFLFLISTHMTLRHAKAKKTLGFGRKLSRKWINEDGRYKNKRRVKLLVLLIVMDSLGRDIPEAKSSVNLIINSLISGAHFVMRRPEPQSKPAPNDPIKFLSMLKEKPDNVIRRAFLGKFGREPTEEELKMAI